MQNEPSGFLSDSQIAPHLIRANSVLTVDQHPQSGEPFVQRDSGVLENRSHFDRELLVTLFALPTALRCQIVVLCVPTLGAYRAISPTESGNRVNASLFIAKV